MTRSCHGRGVRRQGRRLLLSATLESYLNEARAEADRIPAERRADLEQIVLFVGQRIRGSEAARLLFVCTHNSRRSQMAQVWAQTAAWYFRVAGVRSYSGGTEVTAVNPRAVGAMTRAGFAIDGLRDGGNPVRSVRYAEDAEPLECFSKVYDSPPNPTEDFAAVMTCAAADAACPIVAGAAIRISLPFDDPGDFDGTALEQARYDECCRRIAREMLYAFSLVR
jgi:arsenate reductase (thioredoxin)